MLFSRAQIYWHLSACLLIIAFMALATTYSLIVPLWEAPDEVGHFNFISYLRMNHSLPMQRIGELGEAHQPPLYYAIAALSCTPADLDDQTGIFNPNPNFIWANQGGDDSNASLHGSAETFPFQGWSLAVHLARGTSVLMAAATIAFTIAIGWEIFPHRREIGLLGAAFVAFNPQFLFISSVVNNDNLLTMATTGGIWQLLRAMKASEQTRQWVYVGLWVAVGILAKLSAFVIGGVAALVLLGCALKRRSPELFLRGAVTMLLVVGLVTGWWFARQQNLYGDPLGWTMYEKVFAVNIRKTPLQAQDLRDFFTTQFRSFWGYFGWMTISAPTWYYTIMQILSLFGLVGISAFAFRSRKGDLSDFQKHAILLLGAIILLQEFYILTLITKCNASCYQGRYLFPIIAPLMIFLTIGLASLLPKRLCTPTIGGLTMSLFAIALFFLLRVIQPAYQMIPLAKWTLYSIPNKTQYDFGSMFTLQGYKLSIPSKETMTLTLYWQAAQKPDFNYSAFVHLIDSSDQVVVQDDHAPGEAFDYLPTMWQQGDIIANQHVMKMPTPLPPGTYRLRVGLYNWSTGEQLPVSLKEQPVGSFIILDETYQTE